MIYMQQLMPEIRSFPLANITDFAQLNLHFASIVFNTWRKDMKFLHECVLLYTQEFSMVIMKLWFSEGKTSSIAGNW